MNFNTMENSIKQRTLDFIKYKGIKMKTFEQICGLSSGYVTSMRKGFGSDKLNNVLTAYPELNRDWLLYGEGEMLNTETEREEIESSNKKNELIDKFIDEISAQRRVTEKAQEQIDRLIQIIEKQSDK